MLHTFVCKYMKHKTHVIRIVGRYGYSQAFFRVCIELFKLKFLLNRIYHSTDHYGER